MCEYVIDFFFRFSQQDHDESRPASRSYSAEDYLEHSFRPPPPDDRYKSPQRRAAAEPPKAAPRRNHFNDRDVPSSASRANDYKRRSAAYAYEDHGGYCPVTADDDGLPPASMPSREYKRRSAAYASYDDHHQQQQHHHQLSDHSSGGGGGSYNRREMIGDKRMQVEDSAVYPTSPVSPRYRHSYAEAYHRHHNNHHHQQRQSPPPQDTVYRHNGSLQSSGRIGIAAIHPY